MFQILLILEFDVTFNTKKYYEQTKITRNTKD